MVDNYAQITPTGWLDVAHITASRFDATLHRLTAPTTRPLHHTLSTITMIRTFQLAHATQKLLLRSLPAGCEAVYDVCSLEFGVHRKVAMNCAGCRVRCAVCSMLRAVRCVVCAVCSLQCVVCRMLCAVCSMQNAV